MNEAYWRYRDDDQWHKIVSSNPITWTQEIEKGQCPIYYQGKVSYTTRFFTPTSWTSGWILGPIVEYSLTRTFQGGTIEEYLVTLRGQANQSWGGIIQVPRDWPPTLHPLVTQGNVPDDCGDCITTFSTGFSVTAKDCVIVTRTPPECPCCGELLPKASHILAMLP